MSVVDGLGDDVTGWNISCTVDSNVSWSARVAVQAYSRPPPSTLLVGQPWLQAHSEDGVEEWHRTGEVPARFVHTPAGTALVQRAILISCGLIVYMVERRREGREEGRKERSKDGVIGKSWERR